MKLFIVSGGHNYEGYNCWSIRWFRSYKQAEEYGDQLVKDKIYDFYEIVEGKEGEQCE